MTENKQHPVGLLRDSNSPHEAEWKYVWAQIFPMLGIRYRPVDPDHVPPVVIVYGETGRSIPADRFVIRIPETMGKDPLFEAIPRQPFRILRRGGPADLPEWCFSLFQQTVDPLQQIWMAGSETPGVTVSVNEKGALCGLDIPATVFYFLSLSNESRSEYRDQYGRFRKEFSPLGPDVYDIPVVDRLIRLLRELIRFGLKQSGQPDIGSIWPGNKVYAAGLSHDVDKFNNWTLGKIRRAARAARSIRTAAGLIPEMFRADNRSGNFDFIHRLEKRYDVESTAFIVAKRRDAHDPDYTIGDKRIGECIHYLGPPALHGSYLGSSTPGFTSEERGELEAVSGHTVTGVRSHYLTFDHRKTLRLYREAGLSWDSTLGFAEAAGWRCGTGFPFQLWDESRKEASNIFELPLIIMDTSFFLYAGLNAEQAWSGMIRILKETKENGSCAVVNWHNNNLHAGDRTGYTGLYERLLGFLKSENAYSGSLNNLFQTWIGSFYGEADIQTMASE